MSQTCLIDRVHLLLDNGRGDDVVDVGHGLQDGLAMPLRLVLVAELKGLMDT